MRTFGRIAVTLSAELVEEIDRLEPNCSRFTAESVEHELARRRGSLLSSVSNPQCPASIRTAGWKTGLRNLPDDEGLVDLAGGTAVRWVEGQELVEALSDLEIAEPSCSSGRIGKEQRI